MLTVWMFYSLEDVLEKRVKDKVSLDTFIWWFALVLRNAKPGMLTEACEFEMRFYEFSTNLGYLRRRILKTMQPILTREN